MAPQLRIPHESIEGIAESFHALHCADPLPVDGAHRTLLPH
jgi:hypothetical protein